jgi:spore germination cell wall hydrolase CwlJ-like protein
MALTVHYEAEGEGRSGKEAVAAVVLNRAMDRKLTICGAVVEKNQFSWVRGKSKKCKNLLCLKDKIPQASLVKAKWYIDNAAYLKKRYGNVYFFHSKKVRPNWGKKHKKLGVIGGHVFYAENKKPRHLRIHF